MSKPKIPSLQLSVPLLRPSVQRSQQIAPRISGNQWYAIRDRVFKRDGYMCQVCQAEGKVKTASEVDHIQELADGGSNNESNLQSICASHHRLKTNREQARRDGGS